MVQPGSLLTSEGFIKVEVREREQEESEGEDGHFGHLKKSLQQDLTDPQTYTRLWKVVKKPKSLLKKRNLPKQ